MANDELNPKFQLGNLFDVRQKNKTRKIEIGSGPHAVAAQQNRDRTLILGTVMVYSVFLLTFNLLVDIAYAFIDPRIDITAEGA